MDNSPGSVADSGATGGALGIPGHNLAGFKGIINTLPEGNKRVHNLLLDICLAPPAASLIKAPRAMPDRMVHNRIVVVTSRTLRRIYDDEL